jgi:hypothetical protein
MNASINRLPNTVLAKPPHLHGLKVELACAHVAAVAGHALSKGLGLLGAALLWGLLGGSIHLGGCGGGCCCCWLAAAAPGAHQGVDCAVGEGTPGTQGGTCSGRIGQVRGRRAGRGGDEGGQMGCAAIG